VIDAEDSPFFRATLRLFDYKGNKARHCRLCSGRAEKASEGRDANDARRIERDSFFHLLIRRWYAPSDARQGSFAMASSARYLCGSGL